MDKYIFVNLNLDEIGFDFSKIEDFDYAGIKGKADVVGYHIILFYRDGLEALSLDCIDVGLRVKTISNQILYHLECDLEIGQTYLLKSLSDKFNQHIYKNSLLEHNMQYYYLHDNFLYVLGLSDSNVLEYVEIIGNKEIIQSRLSVFK